MPVAQDILKGLIGELKNLAGTETIVGAPFTAGEFTLIPISRVSLGVGAGGGTGSDEKKSASGEGGGGGGGIRVQPVALVSVRGSELNIHMLGRGAGITHSLEKLPDMMEKVFEAWSSRKNQ